MKYIKDNKSENIITDNDITLTGNEYLGKTLSDVLSTIENKQSKLESNIKWIYAYGGVGSSKGSGTGTEDTRKWNSQLSLVNTGRILQQGDTLPLGSSGTYEFGVQIYFGGTATYKITFNYSSNDGTVSGTMSNIISANDSFYASRIFTLTKNGTLNVTIINQDDQTMYTYSIPYIIESYSLDISYVYCDDKSLFAANNHNIYNTNVSNRGIMICISYSFAVELSKFTYTYTDWLSNTVSQTIDVSTINESSEHQSGKIYLDLVPETDDTHSNIKAYLSNNDNASLKTFTFTPNIRLAGNTIDEVIDSMVMEDNLIPSTLYLKVRTGAGTLYTSELSTYPQTALFIPGGITFNITPYYGSYNALRTYNLSIYVDDSTTAADTGINTLKDQQEQSVTVPLNIDIDATITEQQKAHTVRFVITTGNETYTQSYYLYTRVIDSKFDWYPSNVNSKSAALSYYKSVAGQNKFDSTLSGNYSTITMNASSTEVTYSFNGSYPNEGLASYDQMLCLGIQYSHINNTDNLIAKFNSSNDGGSLYVYQDKIVMMNGVTNTGECLIFLQKESDYNPSDISKYHLLTIYKRLEYNSGNNYYKAIYVYIDGILTAVFDNMDTNIEAFESITLSPANYTINLIESSYFARALSDTNDTANTIKLGNDYIYKANTWTTNSVSGEGGDHTYMDDNDITSYYMAYKSYLCGYESTQTEKNIFSAISENFKYDDDNFIKLKNGGIINTIAENTKCPILLINHTYTTAENEKFGSTYNTPGEDNFKKWMSQAFAENTDIPEIDVTIEYASANDTQLATIKPVSSKTTDSAYTFTITPQGSSTLGYRCKNWELAIRQDTDNDDDTLVYSPNYNPDDYSSFLPEESFTLKADVVDSSHSNNNAMGAFINDIVDTFDGSTQLNSKYNTHIKKCLTGFPVLVFLKSEYNVNTELGTSTIDYYFLGIYNFNLGRKSYYNLGYKNTTIFDTAIAGNNQTGLQTGFNVYTISNTADVTTEIKQGVEVAEIQGNNSYFDFSQYDPSVLYKLSNSDNDTTYMFGDFVYAGSTDSALKTSISSFIQKTALAGGYVFDTIGKTYSTSDDDDYGYQYGYHAVDSNGISKNQVPNYRYQAKRTLNGSVTTYTYTQIPDATEADFNTYLISDTDSDTTTYNAVDYKNISEYYTICMAFGMVDSVQKNMNIKSWNGGTKWYLAFYDMDTVLGVSNSGDRISYFAFSDYWSTGISGNSSPYTIQQTTVYRDFSPNQVSNDNSSYYDTPSSYIFAIAKYADIVASDVNRSYFSSYTPNTLWAKWRNTNTSTTDKQQGCLTTANKFIDNYFKGHLDNVPIFVFNSNYRYKYFVKKLQSLQSIGFDEINFPKFYGRKLEYTEDWLNGRFHILDAYFNLNSVSEYFPNTEVQVPYPVANMIDTSNEDIYVLHDIFSTTSTGNQYANLNSNIIVSSTPYSPLICKSPNAVYRYIFPANSDQYTLSIHTNGNQYFLLGGSVLWTYINTINPFITNKNSISITSKYFENISGNDGVCSSWSFTLPAIKTISLTNNSKYSGNITFDSNTLDYPNLNSINISKTSLNLIVNAINSLHTVEALDMEGGGLSITNCSNIQSVTISSTEYASLDVVILRTWKSGTLTLPTNYYTSRNSSYLNCKALTVSNDVTKYPNAKLEIFNNKSLTDLTIEGFSTVTIQGCPKLEHITINDNTILNELSIIIPSSADANRKQLYTNNNTYGVFDISNQTNLTKLLLQRTNIQTLKVRNDSYALMLNSNSLQYNNELMYMSGKATLNGTAVFKNCPKFTLYTNENKTTFTDLTIASSLTSIANMFNQDNVTLGVGAINLDAAEHFLNTIIPDTNNITNASLLFYNQGIYYTKKDFVDDYNKQTCRLSLSKLKKCSNISYIFEGTHVGVINRYMFKNAFTNVSSIAINRVFGLRETYIYATEDCFADIIQKISSITFHGTGDDTWGTNHLIRFLDTETDDSGLSKIKFISQTDEDNNVTYTTYDKPIISMHNVFNPNEIAPTQLTSLSFLDTYTNPSSTAPAIIDFTDMFTSDWTAAMNNGLTITYCWWYNSINVRTGTLDKLFYNINLSYISSVFSDISFKTIEYNSNTQSYTISTPTTDETRIDLYTFINWETGISKCTCLFGSCSNENYNSMMFQKTISYDDFLSLWGSVLKTTKLTTFSRIFYNCIITTSVDIPEFRFDTLVDGVTNTNIMYIDNLFRNCRIYNTELNNTEIPMRLTSTFFKALPNIVNARYAFANTYMEHTIPFNFWRKRYETRTSVYVDVSGSLIKSTLYNYDYKHEITAMQYCFYNIRLSNAQSFNPSASYNNNEFTTAYIDVPGYEDYSPTAYYTTSTATTLTDLIQPTEITDFTDYCTIDSDSEVVSKMITLTATGSNDGSELNETSYNINMVDVANDESFSLTNGSSVHNFRIVNKSYAGPVVSPDIFYGVKYSTNTYVIVGCLYGYYTNVDNSNETFTGYLPPNLLKYCKSTSIENCFTNLNILPIYYNYLVNADANGNPIIAAYYTFVPYNFTTNVSLQNAFKFKIRVPVPKVNSNYNIYTVMLRDSVASNITNVNNMLPGYIAGNNNVLSPVFIINKGALILNAASSNFGTHYHVMDTPIYSLITYTATRNRTRTPVLDDSGNIVSYTYSDWSEWTTKSTSSFATLTINDVSYNFDYTISYNQTPNSNISTDIIDKGYTFNNNQQTIQTWTLTKYTLTGIDTGFDTTYFTQCSDLGNLFNTELLCVSNGKLFRDTSYIYRPVNYKYLINWEYNLLGISRNLILGNISTNNNTVHYISTSAASSCTIYKGSVSNLSSVNVDSYTNTTFVD